MTQTPGSTNWTTSKSDTITVSATDALSPIKSLSLTEDGASTVLTQQANGTYAFAATNLTDGVHTFTATATDSLGNVSTKTITDVVDTTPPVVSTLGGSAFGKTETITGTATDAGSGVAKVDIYDNKVWVGATTVDASGKFTFVESGLAQGAHTFTAVATDNAGNASTLASSPTATAQVGQPPVISGISEIGIGRLDKCYVGRNHRDRHQPPAVR